MIADIVIVGAGPAGSVAAIELANAGFRVVLTDQYDFPRDKVCGDALLPDAVRQLESFGVASKVLESAHVLDRLRVYAPNGTFCDIPGQIACIPRIRLDAILLEKAILSGAEFLPRIQLTSIDEVDNEVRLVSCTNLSNNRKLTLRSRYVILATGASAAPLVSATVCTRTSPSGVAARAYYAFDNFTSGSIEIPIISYDESHCPGYGWIFPGPDNVINLGVGVFYGPKHKKRPASIAEIWKAFTVRFPPAAAIVRNGRQLSRLKGAPLRTGLRGSRVSRNGILVIGEAAGTTYSFSGEGIGKAIESAVIASQCIKDGFYMPGSTSVECAYKKALNTRFAIRFKAYENVQNWLRWPQLCNLLVAKCRNDGFVREELAAILSERSDPRRLFSALGVLRAFFD